MNINDNDLKAIQQIEKELSVKLEKIEKIGKNSKGYMLNDNGQVIGLSLYDCHIKELIHIISPLKDLIHLTELGLSNNQIQDITLLKDLIHLTRLNLRDNSIEDIKPLKNLINLTYLNLWRNQIQDITPLKDLTILAELDLDYNQIKDVMLLKNLINLTELWLDGNRIKDITPLKDLINLSGLNLSGNQIEDITPLKGLIHLTGLGLSNNQIQDITPLKDLVNLNVLLLRSNQINDVTPLKELNKLKNFDLRRNFIEELPVWVVDCNIEILWSEYNQGGINFYDNPLKNPPVEIVKQGKDAIRAYFQSLQGKKTVKLREIKVLLVGEGMAGKTSLLKRLQGLDFNQDESQTHGINVVSLNAHTIKGLENNTKLTDCILHCWDFGGQEIMHASHQFFLSKRALYILVLDSRTDSKKHYWLKHIEKYGGDSPVIVAMNKIDENPNYNIEQKRINDTFSTIQNRFHRISCNTKEGMPALNETLSKTIPQTSLFDTDISINWLNIKDKLVKETQANRYINREQFIAICEENAVKDVTEQLTLLKFLNDLGIVLFFEQLRLSSIYVLDPHWVTIGIYKIINSKKIKKGLLNINDLDFILNRETIKKQEYDPAKDKKFHYEFYERIYILDIMEEFELCYKYYDRNTYIIPDLLPKELNYEPKMNQGISLSFIIEYDYLPTPIISRLMLRLKNDIKQQWKYGMILYNKDFHCEAKVKSEEENRKIFITVQGEMRQKREYFSIIRHHILDINKNFENLKITEYIPLPGHPDFLVEYQELLGYEKAKRDEYFVGKLGKTFSVSEMLDSVIPKEQRERESIVFKPEIHTMINTGKIQDSPVNLGDNNTQTIQK